MSLQKYRQKRDFNQTPEPAGQQKIKSKNLYIIQKHAASHLHYDFRLELNGVLKSWAVPKGPSLDPNIKRLAVHVEDHPVEYGSFEGIIPKGQYGGGTVMLWDQGTWSSLDEDVNKAYKKGHLTFNLQGKKLKGKWMLVQIKSDPKNWLLMKVQDKYAAPEKKIKSPQEDKSVVSKRTMQQIAEKPTRVHISPAKSKVANKKKQKMPENISPALATLVSKPPVGDDWLHEIKFDGYRIITYIKNNTIIMQTRSGLDWTEKFAPIKKALQQLALNNVVFDGEVVAFDEQQKTDFQQLQNALQGDKKIPIGYYIFDLLYYDNENLMKVPLLERKKILQTLLSIPNSMIIYSDHIIGNGQELFAKATKLGLEGIVSKKINSVYQQKRTRDWVKVKCGNRQEFVIAGYTKPAGNRTHFGALLLGTYDKNKKLIYRGRVGTGFNGTSLRTIIKQLKTYRSDSNPFTISPPGAKNINWVKPVLLAEVAYAEMTQDGLLRHASFKGLRLDKEAKKVTLEKPKSLKRSRHAKIK